MNNQISIGQSNCRGLRGKSHELPILMKSKEFLILSETWLHPEIQFKIPGFNLARKDRPKGQIGGGVAIGIKNGIPFHVIPLENYEYSKKGIEAVATKIQLKNDNLILISIYCDEPSLLFTYNALLSLL